MSGWASSRVRLAAAAMATGSFGEILSPALYILRASTDGVIVCQILFIGMFLSGFYMALGEVRPEVGTTQTSSVPAPGNASTETPDVSAEALQTFLRRNAICRTLVDVMAVAVALSILLWLGAEDDAYGLLHVVPDRTLSLLNTSLGTGAFLTLFTVGLRDAMDSHRHVMAMGFLVVMALTGLSWVFVVKSAYVFLMVLIGYLGIPQHIILARLSSMSLLLPVFMISAFCFWNITKGSGSEKLVLEWIQKEQSRTVESDSHHIEAGRGTSPDHTIPQGS